MKIRRALAVAAATAVLAPVTLLSSPAAFAAPSPTPEAGESTPATQEEPRTAPEAEQPAPAPAPDEEQEKGKPATEEGEEKLAAEGEKEEPAEGAVSPTATAPAPSPSATAPAGGCTGRDWTNTDKNLRVLPAGLPSKIVVGSGFHYFKVNVENKGDKAYERVDLGLFAAQVDDDGWFTTAEHFTLQFKNPETAVWTDIHVSVTDDDFVGHIGYTGIRAKESFSIDVRLSVAKTARPGYAAAYGTGVYADDKGNCVFSEVSSYNWFEVLPAGTDAGKPNEAKPNEAKPRTGGEKPVRTKPVGNTPIKPEGTLAQTGSDSDLPVIATIGGVAILAGAGVVFALGRRRKSDTTA
jgi:LPXTG-motif cell wall-anchored protein